MSRKELNNNNGARAVADGEARKPLIVKAVLWRGRRSGFTFRTFRTFRTKSRANTSLVGQSVRRRGQVADRDLD